MQIRDVSSPKDVPVEMLQWGWDLSAPKDVRVEMLQWGSDLSEDLIYLRICSDLYDVLYFQALRSEYGGLKTGKYGVINRLEERTAVPAALVETLWALVMFTLLLMLSGAMGWRTADVRWLGPHLKVVKYNARLTSAVVVACRGSLRSGERLKYSRYHREITHTLVCHVVAFDY